MKHLQEASLPNEEYESYFQVGGDKRCKPFEIEVSIDNHLEWKLTQVLLSLVWCFCFIGVTVYQTLLKGRRLERTNTQLKTYGDEVLKVLGEIEMKVRQEGNETRFPLLVVEVCGPGLLGRNWLAQLQLDLKEIHTLQQTALSQLLKNYV